MTEPTPAQARAYRLRIREQIRERNHERPRCAGCGCDMLKFDQDDFVTPEMMAHPDYSYLGYLDYRAGDLICFWCISGAFEGAGRSYQEGHA
jgi:hypothetical protein